MIDPVQLVVGPLLAVEKRLAELGAALGAASPAVEQLLAAGGKRLRPLLLLLAGGAAGLPADDRAIALASAAELVHTATLLHDDVVDQGDRRRGRATARRVYGNAVAVLAGDACLARALSEVVEQGGPLATRSLVQVLGGLAEAELLQLGRAGDCQATEDGYFDVVERKTAALMVWCATAGQTVPEALVPALEAGALALGMAFQIADDLLDCTGDPERTGKSGGLDLREGHFTLPVLAAFARRPELRLRVQALLVDRGLPASRVPEVLQAVTAAGGVDHARQVAATHAARAVRCWEALPPSDHRDALIAVARTVADRAA